MPNALAVVTGAASGIGLALTQELVARSIDVIAVDKDPIPLDSAAIIETAQIDICDEHAMQALAARYHDRPLAYLFANAGIAAPGTVFGAGKLQWQRAWDINTMGALHTLQCWWPQLQAARGKAVVTASAAALMTYPGAALYRASKAALLSMLESLYYETRGSGVGLHVLCPGLVKSAIVANAIKDDAAAAADPLSRYLAEAMRHAKPARQFAKRVLDELNGIDGFGNSPPFYWLTHADTLSSIEKRYRSIVGDGMPVSNFEEMQ